MTDLPPTIAPTIAPAPMPGLLRTLGATLAISFRSHPRLAVGTLLLVPAGWLPGTVLAVWVKLLVEGALAHDRTRIAVATAALVATQTAGWAAAAIGDRWQHTFQERAGIELGEQLIHASAGRSGIQHLERPEYLDRLDPLRREAWVVHWALEALGHTIGVTVQLVLTVGLLAGVHPLLVLLPLFGVPSLLAARAGGIRDRRAQEAAGADRRRQRHLIGLSTSASAGAEIRLFGLADRLRDRHERSWRAEHRIRIRAAWTTAWAQGLAAAVFGLGFLGAICFIALRVAHGQAGVGDFALTLVLARTLSGTLGGLVGMVGWLAACLAMGARFLWLRDEARAEQRTQGSAGVPDRLRTGISLERVSFRYPGTTRDVLREVSLDLHPGEVVAIVGDNGAGKSSLVKLLCGLYPPTDGMIRLDGMPLRDIDPVAWRRRISGAFQDHARFELSLLEAVTVGDPDRLGDRAAAVEALQRAGAADLLSILESGVDTQLGRSWPGGAELSGGQWQKVALARSVLRTDPLLLVLDEPTAALDARTEDALFRRYAEQLRRAPDCVTVLVSHRFSTVSAADRILVLRAGRIVEQGGHAELMAHGGEYAELYTLQARGYR